MPTVLITGGTGMIGRNLTEVLLQKGFQVIILTRKIADKQNNSNIRYAVWDIKREQIDIAALQEADIIIHLAGAGVVDKKWTAAYKKEIISSRTDSSRLIIEALKNNTNKVKTFISTSAIGWYGADKDPVKPFTENDPAAENFLGRTCKAWEESVAPVAYLGIRLVKLRTGIVLCNEGGALPEFKRALLFGIAAVIGNGKQIVSWIHIDDLSRLFLYAIENKSLEGSYNAVAPEPVSNKTLTVQLAKTMRGRFYIPVLVPSFIIRLVLGQRSVEVLKSTTVSCKKILDTGFTFLYSTIESAITDLVKK